MPRKIIQKRSDPQVQLLRQIRDGKDRSMIFCEGEKLVRELFASHWRPRALFCTQYKIALAESLIPSGSSISLNVLADSVMEFCSDLTSPQGIIALAKPPEKFQPPAVTTNRFVLVIHGVQLPQNIGAMLRTAEAAGVNEVFVSSHSADVWGPKSLRGAAGSAFRLPVHRMGSLTDIVERLHADQIRCVAADQNGSASYDQLDWTTPIALVVGAEGTGFSPYELKLFDETIQIPMRGQVESLNVGNAAAVCLFEGARQRRNEPRK